MQNKTDFRAYRQILILLVIIALLVLALPVSQRLVFGDTKPYVLTEAEPLYGRVAQAITPIDGSGTPIAGRDFTLENTTYFEDKGWVVTTVTYPESSGLEAQMIIMKKTNGVFDIVLGPGTSFDSLSVDKLPNDVAVYVKNNGVVYEPEL